MRYRICTYCEKEKMQSEFKISDTIMLDQFENFSEKMIDVCDECLDTFFIFNVETGLYKEDV